METIYCEVLASTGMASIDKYKYDKGRQVWQVQRWRLSAVKYWQVQVWQVLTGTGMKRVGRYGKYSDGDYLPT